MHFTIQCCERGLSIGAVLVAISTLIADRVQSDHDGRGVVELLHRADLAAQDADIRVAAGRQKPCVRNPSCCGLWLATGARTNDGGGMGHLHIVPMR